MTALDLVVLLFSVGIILALLGVSGPPEDGPR